MTNRVACVDSVRGVAWVAGVGDAPPGVAVGAAVVAAGCVGGVLAGDMFVAVGTMVAVGCGPVQPVSAVAIKTSPTRPKLNLDFMRQVFRSFTTMSSLVLAWLSAVIVPMNTHRVKTGLAPGATASVRLKK